MMNVTPVFTTHVPGYVFNLLLEKFFDASHKLRKESSYRVEIQLDSPPKDLYKNKNSNSPVISLQFFNSNSTLIKQIQLIGTD